MKDDIMINMLLKHTQENIIYFASIKLIKNLVETDMFPLKYLL